MIHVARSQLQPASATGHSTHQDFDEAAVDRLRSRCAGNARRLGLVLAVADATPRAGERPAFTALESAVLQLARRDTRATLRTGRLDAIVAKLFGRRLSPPLANPKLEALRRAAVLIRLHGGQLSSVELHAFQAAGFTKTQLEAVRTMLCSSPSQQQGANS